MTDSSDSDPHPASTKGGEAAGPPRLRIAELYGSLQGEGLLTGTPSVFVRTSGCNLRCWFCDTPHASWNPEGASMVVPDIVQAIRKTAEAGLDKHLESLAADYFSGASASLKGLPGEAIRHVVLTGGEPMLFSASVPLVQMLRKLGFHVTIETAGTVRQDLDCDLISISPKLSSSAPGINQRDLLSWATDKGAEKDSAASANLAASKLAGWNQRHNQRRFRPDVVRELMQRSPYQLKFVVDNQADAAEVLDFLQSIPESIPERVLIMPQGVRQHELDERSRWLVPWCRQHGFVFCPRMHIQWFGNRRGT